MGTLPFAVLFSADRRPSSLLALLSRAVDPRRAAGFPSHLLLLSKSLLPRVLSRSPRLWRARTAGGKLLGRKPIPLHPSECSPIFSVPRRHLSRLPLA